MVWYWYGASASIMISKLALLVAACLLCSEAASEFNCPSPCTCNNSTKSVRCIKKNLHELPTDLPLDVMILDLRNNKIKALAGLGNLTSITSLDLSHNKISELTGFTSLRNLTYLDMSHNAIGDITALANLSNMVHLDLSHNSLAWSTKEGWLQGLTSLQQLKLTQNALTSPPTPLCSRLPALQVLFLDNNEMTGPFPDEYSSCQKLTRLTLSNNNFDAINSSLLCSLSRGTGTAAPLSLKLNRLKLVESSTVEPGALACLSGRLQSLDLSQNKLSQENLEALVGGGSGLRQLKSLNLRKSTHLRSLSQRLLSGLAKLEVLMLDGSGGLTELSADALALTPLLRLLSLSRTGVAGWTGRCLDQLARLTQLDLRNTSVSTIGGLSGSDANPLHLLTDSSKFANLSLAGAPLACDCSIYWLTQQLAQPSVLAKLADARRITCAQPVAMRTRPLLGFAPTNCAGFFTPRMIIIFASSGAAFLLIVAGLVVLGVVCRRRRLATGGGEAPRLVFNGVDDMRDPLVAPDDGRRRDTVWIRLRRFLRQRRERSSASTSPSGQQRPPIFDPHQHPEDYLSADDA